MAFFKLRLLLFLNMPDRNLKFYRKVHIIFLLDIIILKNQSVYEWTGKRLWEVTCISYFNVITRLPWDLLFVCFVLKQYLILWADPRIPYVAKDGPSHSASTSQVLGLQVCAAMTTCVVPGIRTMGFVYTGPADVPTAVHHSQTPHSEEHRALPPRLLLAAPGSAYTHIHLSSSPPLSPAC